MINNLFRFNGGVHPDPSKTDPSSRPIAVAPVPKRLVVPLRQHSGEAAQPVVNVGEAVLKGQKIGAPVGELSAAVHAPTSGSVVAIDPQPVPHSSGRPVLCITIDSDGLDRAVDFEPMDYRSARPQAIRARLREAGVVGMGGAVFPSHVKANGHDPHPIDTLIINAAECEPYISCDDLLMRERTDEVVHGIEILRYTLGAARVLIGTEDNKARAVDAMRRAIRARGTQSMDVVVLPTLYPVGGAKQLIRVLTGLEIPANEHAIDYGVQCFNLGTAYSVYRAVHLGEPVISRVVTVAGNVDAAQNYEVRIGTPMHELFTLARERADTQGYIMGGPLMGFELPSKAMPVVKATNCIIAATPKLVPSRYREMPCIRCGQCALACPIELQPHELYWFSKSKNLDKAREYSVLDCIECGACSYSCPSHIPLVDYYRSVKSAIRAQDDERRAADSARDRFELRQARLAREQDAKQSRQLVQLNSIPLDASGANAHGDSPHSKAQKQAVIQAAVARAREQREAFARTHQDRSTA